MFYPLKLIPSLRWREKRRFPLVYRLSESLCSRMSPARSSSFGVRAPRVMPGSWISVPWHAGTAGCPPARAAPGGPALPRAFAGLKRGGARAAQTPNLSGLSARLGIKVQRSPCLPAPAIHAGSIFQTLFPQ